jgi:hypothetical protein
MDAMPFDGTTAKKTRRPERRTTALQSALVLDMVEFSFHDGAMWVSGQWETCDGKRCLLQAVSFVRRQIGSRADRAPAYLARAIRDNDYKRTQDRIIAYNDARGRTYREIAALIREAKALAEADSRRTAGNLDNVTEDRPDIPCTDPDAGFP